MARKEYRHAVKEYGKACVHVFAWPRSGRNVHFLPPARP